MVVGFIDQEPNQVQVVMFCGFAINQTVWTLSFSFLIYNSPRKRNINTTHCQVRQPRVNTQDKLEMKERTKTGTREHMSNSGVGGYLHLKCK